MAIHEVEIENYRGIRTLRATLPEGGVIAEGGNGKGKTSFVRALQAALTGSGFGADSISVGADSSRVFVRMTDGTEIARSVAKGGSPRVAVSLRTSSGRAKPEKPSAWLAQAIGVSIDPLEFYLAKGKERREIVLRAMPVMVTREQLLQWAPEIPTGLSLERHGLEVVSDLHAHYYALRTRANAAADEASRAATTARVAADNAPGGEDVDLAKTEAAARAAAQALASQRAAHSESRKAHGAWKQRAGMIADADAGIRDAEARADTAEAEADAARASLREAMQAFLELSADADFAGPRVAIRTALDASDRSDTAAASARRKVTDLRRQRAALAEAVGQEPALISDEAVADAERALREAEQDLADARAHSAAARERARLTDAAADQAARAAAAKAEADRLDKIVKALGAAPAELIAKSDGIPGLGISGDAITLDGRPLDSLCGAEQLQLAVEIAKRANGGAAHQIMVVDGLERLDDEQLATFRSLTDGWDVIATRVTTGDLRLEALHGGTADLKQAEVHA